MNEPFRCTCGRWFVQAVNTINATVTRCGCGELELPGYWVNAELFRPSTGSGYPAKLGGWL